MILILKSVFFVLFGCLCYLVVVTTEETNPYTFNFNIKNKHLDAIYQRCTGSCNKKYCKIISSCRPFNLTSKRKRLDIYLHDGLKFEAPILFEINAFKKFRTQYQPHLVKYKEELCSLLLMKDHPFFKFFGIANINGNLLDPCPMTGHRFEAPKLTSTWISTLVPTGDWRMDFIVSKVINATEEHILTVSQYVLVKANDATDEF